MNNCEEKRYGPVHSFVLIIAISMAIGSALVLGRHFPWLNRGLGLLAASANIVVTTLVLLSLLLAAWRRFTPRGFFITVLATILGFIGLATGVIWLLEA